MTTVQGTVQFDLPPIELPPTVGFPCLEDLGVKGWDPSLQTAEEAEDSGPAMQTALRWAWARGVVLQARSAHYVVKTPVVVEQGPHELQFSTGARLPWGMDLSHALITSRVASGYTLDFKSRLMAARHLYLKRFSIYGGAAGGLCLRAREEAAPTDGGAFVLPRVSDVNVIGAGGIGFLVWGEVFEGNFRDISARDCKSHGFVVKHGDSPDKGVPSSLVVDGFNFSMNAGHGAHVVTPCNDVRFRDGDLISNWLNGIYLANGVPSDFIDGCHFENNFMSTASAPSLSNAQVRLGNGGTLRNCRMLDSLKGGAKSLLGGYIVNPVKMDSCFVQGTGNVLATVTGGGAGKLTIDGCLGSLGSSTVPRTVV